MFTDVIFIPLPLAQHPVRANLHVDLGRPTGLPLCPIGRGAACAKVGKEVKNSIPTIGWNKTLRVFDPGLCPSDAKGSIHLEPNHFRCETLRVFYY